MLFDELQDPPDLLLVGEVTPCVDEGMQRLALQSGFILKSSSNDRQDVLHGESSWSASRHHAVNRKLCLTSGEAFESYCTITSVRTSSKSVGTVHSHNQHSCGGVSIPFYTVQTHCQTR